MSLAWWQWLQFSQKINHDGLGKEELYYTMNGKKI